MSVQDGNKIKFVKMAYGEKNYQEKISLPFGDTNIVGWVLVGLPTLSLLEEKFTDDEILSVYEQQDI